jgi:predicted RNase H-like nuclease (RuvC/YqgF family)
VNVSIGDCDCGCKHILPNDGQGLTYSKKYFVNEWNGKTWMRKEVAEGESVVVFKDGEKDYAEYRVVNGELVDVASMVYDDVMENITPIVANLETEIQTLDAKIDAEIERSTTKDNEIETSVNSITERLTEDEAKINKNIQDIEDLNANITEIGTTLEALDAELEEEKQARADADNAINEHITSLQETVDTLSETVGTVDGQTIVDGSYDKDNGTLTLNRKNGENNITVQFNFNFGTF